jgi:hypothetical protein
MTSNLPLELAVFRFFAKSSMFWFEAGTLLESTHETYAQGADGLGRPRMANRGELLILTYAGNPLKLEYAAEKIHCVINQPIIVVLCNGYFVGYHNYNQGLHHSFGNLPLAVGSKIAASDYFKPQFKTIAWGIAALWWSQGFYVLTSVLLLHGRIDLFASEIPSILFRFCLWYFLPLTVLNMVLGSIHKARAEKRVWAILNYAQGALQQRILPTAWREIPNKGRQQKIRARFPALAGVAVLIPIVLAVLFYMRTAKPGKLPSPPTVVSVAIWLCLLASGLLFTWALAATRLGRKVAWVLGLVTLLLAGSFEPWAVEDVLIAPVRWVQLGFHFWLIFLPLATLWFFAKDMSGAAKHSL